MSKAIEKKESAPPQELRSSDIESRIISLVKDEKIDPDKLEKFINLQFKMEERQAEKAFNQAMAGFQGDCPNIPKTKRVKFKSVDYKYSPLEEIVTVIRPHLNKWGLSYSFDIKKTDNKDELNLVTTIRHRDGHAAVYDYYFNRIHDDDRMNKAQRAKSSVTFTKRAALENALGLTTDGQDDDGRGLPDSGIEKDQKQQILDLAEETKTNIPDVLNYMKIDAGEIDDLTELQARKLLHLLKEKKRLNS